MNNNETIFTYEYPYTKDRFLEDLNSQFGKDGVQDYTIKRKENGNFFLGVERAGHSGGNWYVANVTEVSGKTQITGKIVCNPDKNGQETKNKRSISEILGTILFYVLFGLLIAALIIVFSVVLLFEKIINIFRKKPKPTFLSKEEKLDKFMLEYLNCKKL